MGDILNRMVNAMSQENMPTSSNPNPDALEIQRDDCPICGGLGVVRYEVPIDDPRFGKLFKCPGDHPALEDERQERFRKISNLQAYEDKTFANFETERPGLSIAENRSLLLAYDVARRFASNPDGWLLLEGTYGCGKSHLAAAVGNARLDAGDSVLFVTAPDLLDHLRSTYSASSEIDYGEMFTRIRNAPFLIIDDLGAESPSEWAQEKLFQLLNHRYSHRLPTIITTNVDLDRLDGRVRSRLLDEAIIHRAKIMAPDYRTVTQSEQQQFSSLVLYHDMHFENFDTQTNTVNGERDNLDKALRAAWDYAIKPQGWLIILGEYGTGKTHLAASIAHYRQQHGEDVLFLTTPDLLDYLRKTFNPDATVTLARRLQQLRNTHLLILDDLDTDNASSWAKEKLFQILEHRYAAAKPTVITTAKSIEDTNPRIRTRLLDKQRCSIFALTVPDYATRMNRR
ncbi:MAG: hypothetical protein CUN54_01985 [Phototrophicales bacterium]|nr:MAG: hypothetical protein CUN54_01985 [Phototrophicales bacterium]